MIAGLESVPNRLNANAKPAQQRAGECKNQSSVQTKEEDELEQIMRDMDINDIQEDTVEDLDLDKILEVPIEGEKNNQSASNQVMSSEEIASLIAKTDLMSSPEPIADDLPDLSYPSYVMSSEEIAALIANM